MCIRPRFVNIAALMPALAVALAVCTSCGSDSSSGAAAEGTAAPKDSTYPTSIVAIGHSGLTGYDSNPQASSTDAQANSWATGTNSAVDSIYQRILAKNPAVKNHVQNFAVDGSDVNSLLDQEAQAAAATPTPGLVIVQSIDNDIKCDGTDAQNFGPYKQKLTAVMDALTKDLPNAKVFFVSQWATVKEYDRVVLSIDPQHLSGTGPCATVNLQTHQLDPKREAHLQHLVNHYFAIITAVCSNYPGCSTDQGAMQTMHLNTNDLAPGLDHLSIPGLHKMAALAWPALYPN